MVTITKQQNKLLDDLSELQGRSKGSYLAELLDGAEDVLRALLPVLRAHSATVKAQPEAVRDVVALTLSGVYGDEAPSLLDAIERAEQERTARTGGRTDRTSSVARRSSRRKADPHD